MIIIEIIKFILLHILVLELFNSIFLSNEFFWDDEEIDNFIIADSNPLKKNESVIMTKINEHTQQPEYYIAHKLGMSYFSRYIIHINGGKKIGRVWRFSPLDKKIKQTFNKAKSD